MTRFPRGLSIKYRFCLFRANTRLILEFTNSKQVKFMISVLVLQVIYVSLCISATHTSEKNSLQTICDIMSVSLCRDRCYDRDTVESFSNFVRGKVSTSDTTGLTSLLAFALGPGLSDASGSPGTSCVSEGNWVPFSVLLSLPPLFPTLDPAN